MSLSADLGLISVFDTQPIDIEDLKGGIEEYFLEHAKRNVQILIEQLMKLPSHRDDQENLIVELPKPVTPLPREKPLPIKPEPTVWEKFAQKKGIGKFAKGRSKDRLLFDDETQEWLPKWGMRKKQKDIKKEDIIIEHQPGEKLKFGVDVFEEREKLKREARQKQSKREEKNIENAFKQSSSSSTTERRRLHEFPTSTKEVLGGIPASVSYTSAVFDAEKHIKQGTALTPSLKGSKDAVKKMMIIAQHSLGKRGKDGNGERLGEGFKSGREWNEAERERDAMIARAVLSGEGSLNASKAARLVGRIGKDNVFGTKRMKTSDDDSEGSDDEDEGGNRRGKSGSRKGKGRGGGRGGFGGKKRGGGGKKFQGGRGKGGKSFRKGGKGARGGKGRH
ncbi:putative ribosomal biogenesis regulatory protein [Monocercomonoides exilis]|uniref:putative ribosomal biogenesis regulatory protein n=1 Tax=Monocercomonoides exilis TaxID=2049356 RepID=UPI00355A8802|nr:putative ribosomal biogenesis regulatory protein [Monocercomonoides exilis]|eukprot:MONOS_4571.1-p1 / transcript=MONOS_4571.1 / gene=MONOS_4571 / organism=Monocercomonoides_exilis_PA203 / gene_product=ribosomal biogenesis regulatory protein / transcript_product=ribosomal biogenesis regulatory protein / location=Mono_scaffold00122:114543-115819(-) / protein_length=391 / sequence_SO=supercontig / SO=protein_coding / is_pseudo=false